MQNDHISLPDDIIQQLCEALKHSQARPGGLRLTPTDRLYRTQLEQALETGAALDQRVLWYALGELAESAALGDEVRANQLITRLRELR
jgi:hypothetical protein